MNWIQASIVPLALYLGVSFLGWSASSCRWKRALPEKDGREVLVVTAHPDDECLFFAPTILGMKQEGIPVHLLCLSRGNFSGLGKTRELELQEAAVALGISLERTKLVDRHELEDGLPHWESSSVKHEIRSYIEKHPSVTDIVTFDRLGVSGHSNHRDIYWAIQSMLDELTTVECWYLRSVSIVQKYTGLIGALLTALIRENDEFVYLLSRKETAIQSMRCHKSQYVWFRRLYVTFSSYMHVNVLKKMVVPG